MKILIISSEKDTILSFSWILKKSSILDGVSLGIRGASTMSVHNEKATQSSKQRGAPDSNDVRISSMPMAKEENCSRIIMIQAVKGPIHEHVRDAKYLN